MNYAQCEQYILDIPKLTRRSNQDNLRRILKELGEVHLRIPCIHVAGTNGKGSTCAFLESVLREHGYRVGLFTSPHLVTMRERLQINRQNVSEEEFVFCFNCVKEAVEKVVAEGGRHPNFFEFLFAMAAVWFWKEQADYVIYETGMGGRLDATNLVKPEATIITSIGMDHMQFLGDTLEQIAFEKAGILKQGCPIIYCNREERVTEVIRKQADIVQAIPYSVESNEIVVNEITDKTIDFSFKSRYDNEGWNTSFAIPKTGIYQIENASLAILTARLVLGERGKEEYIQSGIAGMYWSARMEEIAQDVYVDGAHNTEAIQVFSKTLNTLYAADGKELVFAVAKDKDYEEMIHYLSTHVVFKRIMITTIQNDRRANLTEIAEHFERYCDCPVEMEEDCNKALQRLWEERPRGDKIFCVGSLYLAGSILENWKE